MYNTIHHNITYKHKKLATAKIFTRGKELWHTYEMEYFVLIKTTYLRKKDIWRYVIISK